MARCPLTLHLQTVAAMLNCEFSDTGVYDGLELQWFDDETHGTGMLAFLSRREGREVDYYVQPGLHLDRADYHLGGGTGTWQETEFDTAHLQVSGDGVVAEVRFTDVDGRLIEVQVDDRSSSRRRPGGLLAPVGDGITEPESLLLVWMPVFDLVRDTGTPPVFRIGGEEVATGRLPGARWHRRRLVKYAAPLVVATLARTYDGPLDALPDALNLGADGSATVTAKADRHTAQVVMAPAMPDLTAMPPGTVEQGTWWVLVDDVRLTGGSWSARADDGEVAVDLEVTERWRPGRLPPLMRMVTTVVPVFRKWPTTYRWRGVVTLGEVPSLRAGWQRTGTGGAERYRRRTGG